MPDVTGTAIELYDADLTLKEVEALLSISRQGRKALHRNNLNLGIYGDTGSGTVRLVTQAQQGSDEVTKLTKELNGYLNSIGRASQFATRDANVRDERSHMSEAKLVNKAKLLMDKYSMDMEYDPVLKEMRAVHEVGNFGTNIYAGYKSASTRQENAKAAEINDKLLSRRPGTTQLQNRVYTDQDRLVAEYNERLNWAWANTGNPRAKDIIEAHTNRTTSGKMRNKTWKYNETLLWAQANAGNPLADAIVRADNNKTMRGRMANRVADYNARLAWARDPRNRSHPIARAIRKAHWNKSAGGRILNKAATLAKGAIIGTVVSAIGIAVNTAVKLLLSLPDIAKNVLKIASQGAMFNLPAHLIEGYKGLSKSLFGKEDTDIVQGYHAYVHRTAGDIVNNNMEGALGKLAAVLQLGGGSGIEAMTGYFRKDPNYDTDKVTRAITNDVIRASFAGQAIGYSGGDIGVAFSSNIAALMAENAEAAKFVGEMYRVWEQIDVPERTRIQKEVSGGADFTELMMKYLESPNAVKTTGAIAYGRSKEVANKGNQIWADVVTSVESILRQILAAIEPILEFLREMYYGLLEGLNESPLFYGKFNEQLFEHREKNRVANVAGEKQNAELKQLAQWNINVLREKLGIKTDIDEMFKSDAFLAGLSHNDAADVLVAMGFLKHVEDKEKEFAKEKLSKKPKRVSNVTPLAASYSASSYAVGKMYDLTRIEDAVIDIYANQGAEGLRKKISGAEQQKETLEQAYRAWSPIGGKSVGRGQNYVSPYTHKAYITYQSEIADLENYIAQAKKILAVDTATVSAGNNPRMNTGYYTGGRNTYDSSAATRESAEMIPVRASLLQNINAGNIKYSSDYIGSRFASDVWDLITSNAIRVEVHLDEDKKDYTFHLVNDRGKEVGKIHEISNPISRTYHNSDFFGGNLHATLEAREDQR